MKSNDYIKIIITLFTLAFISACEDAPPTDYIPRTFVEGYLIVDEPIRNIMLLRTLAVSDSFNYKESFIDDATVIIKEESGQEYALIPRNDSIQGYYFPDTTVLIKPKTKYSLDITLKDGSRITSATTTPGRTSWAKEPHVLIQYPKDTIKLPAVDSLKFSWQAVPGVKVYLIRITAIDTLNYGIYLTPRTEEKNRRIERPFGREDRYYNDLTRWAGPIPNTEAPVVWNGLKWFGWNEVTVFACDYNFIRWFIHMQRRNQYEPLLGSVEGAMGVFGSASTVKKNVFIFKNQP